jgi:hypothetical protein
MFRFLPKARHGCLTTRLLHHVENPLIDKIMVALPSVETRVSFSITVCVDM